MSTETDQDNSGSESPSSPRLKPKPFSLPLNLSPSHNGQAPSSPESDLDVDSAPDDATPENLSLKKKESSKSPNGQLNTNGANNHIGFIPYHQQAQQYHQSLNVPVTQRSPIDVLLR